MPAVIFTDTYTLAMPSAPDAATVTVTVDATGGGYHWNYHVVNDGFDPSGASDIGMFAIPVGDPADVSGLGTSMGEWTGGVGELAGVPDQVFWTGGEFIDQIGVGESADFWFTTSPTAVVLNAGFVADSGFAGQAAGLEAAPAPALVVTTELDNRVANDGLTSLREAIDTVNSPQNLAGFWRVTFAANLDGATITMNPTLGQFDLTRDIFIDGPASKITVQRDPNTAVQHRIFQATGGNTTTLARLILLNGDVTGTGGAVFALGNLKVQDCEIRDNRASDAGGGLTWGGNSLEITGSAINGNTANIGGGVYTSGTTATISSSQIGLNYASLSGGGLFVSQTAAGGPTNVTLIGVDVAGNQAVGQGGGISADSPVGGGAISLALAGGTNIHGNRVLNTTAGQGGGLYFGSGTLTLFGVTFQDNDAANGDGIYRRTVTSVTFPSVVNFVNDSEVVGP